MEGRGNFMPLLISAIVIIVGALVLRRVLQAQRDPREPPYIAPTIPWIGHTIGVLRYKTRYHLKVNLKYQYPVFTLPMLAGKLYVVSSLDMIAAIQRHPKVLSFWYLEALFGKRLGAISDEADAKMMSNIHRDQGDISMFDDGVKFMAKVLRPGDALGEMNLAMARTISASFEKFDFENRRPIDLWEWVQHELTMATTDAVYGPLNPYRDEKIESAFRDVSDRVSVLLFGLLPNVLARKAYVGREKVTEAFEKYFTAAGHKQASVMTQGRYDTTKRHGVSDKDIARLEIVQGVTILANTLPSAFWIIFHVLSRPAVLESVRNRAEDLIAVKEENGVKVRTLKVGGLRDDPMLSSVVHEALRHQSSGATIRMVMEDIMLEDRYLLKKGNLVIMPMEAVHLDRTLWANPQEFNHERFAKPDFKTPAGAFRAFGGGANLCPGRFFAITEALFVAIMVVLKYEVVPTGGKWISPQPNTPNTSFVVAPPDSGTLVSLTPRKGWEDVRWNLEI